MMHVLSLRTSDKSTGARLLHLTTLADAMMYCVVFAWVVWMEASLAMQKEGQVQNELEEGLLFKALEDDEEAGSFPSAFGERSELEEGKYTNEVLHGGKVGVALR